MIKNTQKCVLSYYLISKIYFPFHHWFSLILLLFIFFSFGRPSGLLRYNLQANFRSDSSSPNRLHDCNPWRIQVEAYAGIQAEGTLTAFLTSVSHKLPYCCSYFGSRLLWNISKLVYFGIQWSSKIYQNLCVLGRQSTLRIFWKLTAMKYIRTCLFYDLIKCEKYIRTCIFWYAQNISNLYILDISLFNLV